MPLCVPVYRLQRASCCRSGIWSAWCRCGSQRCGGSLASEPFAHQPMLDGLEKNQKQLWFAKKKFKNNFYRERHRTQYGCSTYPFTECTHPTVYFLVIKFHRPIFPALYFKSFAEKQEVFILHHNSTISADPLLCIMNLLLVSVFLQMTSLGKANMEW